MNQHYSWLRLRFWHRWLGLVVMLPLLIAAISGSLLVYKKPLIRLIVTNSAALPINYSQTDIAIQLDQLAVIVAQYDVNRLTAPNQQEPYWTLTQQSGYQRLYSVNTLHEYAANRWLLDVFSFVHHLHTELLTGAVGQTVLLISGVCGLLLLCSGIWLWWPGRKGFRWRFIRPWPFKLKMVLQLHRHSGIVIAPVLLIILLTGSLMLWQKLVAPLLTPVAMQTVPQDKMPGYKFDVDALLSPSQALAQAQRQLPDGWPVFIRLAQNGQQLYRFRFRLADEWHPNGRTNIEVTAASGAINMTPRADTLPWQYRLLNQLYPFHSSYGINGLYQILIIITGCGLVWLSVTGLISYLRQKMHRPL